MGTGNVILFLFCALMFIPGLLSRVSPIQSRRDIFIITHGITLFASIGYWLLAQIISGSQDNAWLLPYFLAFALPWPVFVAWLVNHELFKGSPGKVIWLTTDHSQRVISFLLFLLFLSSTIGLILGLRAINNLSTEIYLDEHIRWLTHLGIGFFLIIAPSTLLVLISIFARRGISSQGIFTGLVILRWLDIQSYAWLQSKKEGEHRLAVKYKPLHFTLSLELTISAQDKPAVENLLTQYTLSDSPAASL